MDAAFVTTTVQEPEIVAVSADPLTKQPLPVTANVSSPVPDPPLAARTIAVPTVLVDVEPDTVKVACAAPAAGASVPGTSPRITGAPASAAPDPPHPVRSITALEKTAAAAFPLVEPESEPEPVPNAPKRP